MSDDLTSGVGELRPAPHGRSYSDTEMQELLAAYVIGALEPDEMLAVEEFLAAHPEWEARLKSLEMTAASLAHAAPRAPLPARARAQLLQHARAELPSEPLFQPLTTTSVARRTPLLSASAQVQPAARGLRGMRSIPAAQPRPLQSGPGWFGVFWRSVVAAGAVAIILLLAGLTWQLRNSVAQLSAQVKTLQNQLTQVETESTRLRQDNASLLHQVEILSTQEQVIINPQQRIILTGTVDAPSASGDFYRRGEVAVLVLRGLAPLPPDQTYQLWILPPGNDPPLPADLIQVANSDAQTVNVTIPPEQRNLVGIGVSVEPLVGSQTPTTILLLGKELAPRA